MSPYKAFIVRMVASAAAAVVVGKVFLTHLSWPSYFLLAAIFLAASYGSEALRKRK